MARNVPAPNNPPQRVVASATSESLKLSSGPIPSPEILAEYNRIFPGLGERIIVAFEAEYSHRHQLASTGMSADIEAMRLDHRDAKTGQILGFGITITGLLAASILIYLGHDWAGATIGGGSLASLVTAYFKSSPIKLYESNQPPNAPAKKSN